MSTDVVVVGAGVIGSSIALELSRAGRRVTVVDKAGGVGFGSTSASRPTTTRSAGCRRPAGRSGRPSGAGTVWWRSPPTGPKRASGTGPASSYFATGETSQAESRRSPRAVSSIPPESP
ncbi:FAD-dependent oxidoreductase [Streptomyces sp. NPDC058092]|uniref:FAD-dependent oxidoreductase n=1 Tax=Streptomyces sp. NPDC058092 TaxID=3346336 RepID=UPI0036EEEDC1